MPHPSLKVASKFIDIANEECMPISNMKLQKMIYIANGLCLAATDGTPLINEEIEAWDYGPVIRSVYDKYKKYGNNDIDNSLSYSSNNLNTNLLNDNMQFSELEMDIINYTWNITKELNAYTLSNWTHENNSPWDLAYRNSIRLIPNDAMTEYFKTFISDND